MITNEETTKIIEKYNYDTFFTIQKDEKGSIQIINANVLRINQVTSDIAVAIQKALDNNEKNKIYIYSGAITGIRFLSGTGPRIPLKIASVGNIDTDLRSEFISQGVNQTLHRVYLNVKTNVSILSSFKTIESSIENQVLIAEHVIIGEIPSNYYNFNGMENEKEALRLVE
jgi:sporulation protein YunB